MTNHQVAPLGQVSDFDIRLIRVFKAVVECGGFSAAEGVLGVGRSAISLHMNDLERRLGLRLCQRGRGGFSLTEEGRQVYEAGLTLLASLETFRTEVNGLHENLRGELNIGITDNLVSMPEMHITHALATLKGRGPEVRINIAMEAPDSIARGVVDGRLHVGVVPEVNLPSSLVSEALYDERSLLYCADSHPLFAETVTNPQRLAAHEAVVPGYPLPEAARAAHARLRGAATASDREGAAFLILTGCYIGYLPDHLAAPWVAAGRLQALCHDTCHYRIPLVAITQRDRRPHRVLEAFLAALG
ncbi:MAG: LysR family transcriptional regulator [Halomonas sp.]|uniref:LysR family transcriptional regulator n=1 Tax=Halomonas sp. TaxID=1486246 RepID=UPI0028700858|nr:LysR family transcriptional regulator [Halomonas sp.]MDR9439300.1 LysR family transcriptional regulator [Halomonas sp.]